MAYYAWKSSKEFSLLLFSVFVSKKAMAISSSSRTSPSFLLCPSSRMHCDSRTLEVLKVLRKIFSFNFIQLIKKIKLRRSRRRRWDGYMCNVDVLVQRLFSGMNKNGCNIILFIGKNKIVQPSYHVLWVPMYHIKYTFSAAFPCVIVSASVV